MLAVKDLHGYYGASHVLHGVTLEAGRGELVGLLGRNGAGKTTLLSAIVGTVTTRDGSVMLDGEDLTGREPFQRLRRGLALVPSGARVFGNLTVEENLDVVRPRPVEGGETAWTVPRVYEFFPKLADLRASMAGNLSGGERQMLAVGRGLMSNPKVLLLDEPSEGLAPVVIQAIGQLMRQLKEVGLTMVLAEQNHRFALRHADRAYLIEKGQIQHQAPAAELEGSEALNRYLGV
jgi:branched-chain amino acid transport system ATP-binding protein